MREKGGWRGWPEEEEEEEDHQEGMSSR